MLIQRMQFYWILLLSLSSCHEVVVYKTRKVRESDSAETGQRNSPDTSILRLLSNSKTLSIYELMSQHWEADDVDKAHFNEVFWDSVHNMRKYSSLYLFPDSTFTENPRADIIMGRWVLNKPGRELMLFASKAGERDCFIDAFALAELSIRWERNKNTIAVNYISDNIVYKNPLEDPFHPTHNRWRVKPAVPESPEQIRQRVKDFVFFYHMIFKDNRSRRDLSITFTGLPNCFTWYNGGIALQSTLELDRKWISCFYSEDQARQGYDLIKNVLDRHQLKWPKNAGGWIEELQSILGQIHDQL